MVGESKGRRTWFVLVPFSIHLIVPPIIPHGVPEPPRAPRVSKALPGLSGTSQGPPRQKYIVQASKCLPLHLKAFMSLPSRKACPNLPGPPRVLQSLPRLPRASQDFPRGFLCLHRSLQGPLPRFPNLPIASRASHSCRKHLSQPQRSPKASQSVPCPAAQIPRAPQSLPEIPRCPGSLPGPPRALRELRGPRGQSRALQWCA